MTAGAVLEPMTEPTSTPATHAKPSQTLANVDRIVLTGFMGSGKTTVGRLLAAQLGWAFHDLDNEIERRTARTVPQIFAESGEAAFRRQESAALASLLGQHHIVLALGGGAPETFTNQLMLEQTPHTAVMYLKAPLETLIARCERQAKNTETTARPLLGEAAERFVRRRPIYERVARHHVTTSEMKADQVVDAILDELRKTR
jgi:shikimate kinase